MRLAALTARLRAVTWRRLITLTHVTALSALLLMPLTLVQGATTSLTISLAEAVTAQGVRTHMAALQRVADANGGTRAAGTPGYAASVRYVRKTLQAAGYQVRVQPFNIEISEVLAARGRTLGDNALPLAPVVMENSPSTPEGGLEAPLTRPTEALGCSPNDFAGVQGTVVLVERGLCTFAEKSQNAAAAGATAVLIYDSDAAFANAPFSGSLGDVPRSSTVPTAGVTRAVGEQLIERLEHGTVRVSLALRVSHKRQQTANVIAELPENRAQNIVMVGAHLDSVTEGPGINDNGSGVALVLELARKLAQAQNAQGVRFAFWGAEELGLLGSYHYVESLSATELESIRAYLNFDMVDSPNAVPFVYGDPALSALFRETFSAEGIRLETADLNGSSDHASFSEAGVLVAGLFTGAGGSKSPGQAARYGGVARTPYDRCYHQACDTLASSDTQVATRYLDLIADAAAGTLEQLLSNGTLEQ